MAGCHWQTRNTQRHRRGVDGGDAGRARAKSALHIPAREKPYYLDGPLVLKSGQRLTADRRPRFASSPAATLAWSATSMSLASTTGPCRPACRSTWTSLSRAVSGLRSRPRTRSTTATCAGTPSKENPVFGTHGVILLQNVRRVTVKSVTIRQSRPFGVHLANVHEFRVENITLDHPPRRRACERPRQRRPHPWRSRRLA